MKFPVGTWVEVTVTRLDGPDLISVGKVVEATPDYAIADCAGTRFTMRAETEGYVSFRRMTGADWSRRRQRR